VKSDPNHANDSPEPPEAVEGCYDLEDLPLRVEELRHVQLMHQMASALEEFDIKGREVTKQEVEQFRAVIEHARGKKDIQRFLWEHPHILAWRLDGENGRWCIPEKGVGSEYAPDFLLAELGQIGLEWRGLELQSPHAKLFRKDGNPSAALNDAVRRVVDWRTWLRNNIDYARRPSENDGLNLIDISVDIPYYIFIGRQRDLNDNNRNRRRQMSKELKVQIHTYDWLIKTVEDEQKNSNKNRRYRSSR